MRQILIPIMPLNDKYCDRKCTWGVLGGPEAKGIISCSLFSHESCWDAKCGKNPNGTNETNLRCWDCREAERCVAPKMTSPKQEIKTFGVTKG